MKPILLITLIALIFLSCYRPRNGGYLDITQMKVPGYKPVYSQNKDLINIKFMGPREMKIPGKIYVKDDMILQNDIGSGIHVYNKSIPSRLRSRGFIQIPGNVELSIKGNFIYANSFKDLVVIDIGRWINLKEVKRIPDAFIQGTDHMYSIPYIPLPEKGVYYECVDYKKGVQVGWQKDSVYTYCFYSN